MSLPGRAWYRESVPKPATESSNPRSPRRHPQASVCIAACPYLVLVRPVDVGPGHAPHPTRDQSANSAALSRPGMTVWRGRRLTTSGTCASGRNQGYPVDRASRLGGRGRGGIPGRKVEFSAGRVHFGADSANASSGRHRRHIYPLPDPTGSRDSSFIHLCFSVCQAEQKNQVKSSVEISSWWPIAEGRRFGFSLIFACWPTFVFSQHWITLLLSQPPLIELASDS